MIFLHSNQITTANRSTFLWSSDNTIIIYFFDTSWAIAPRNLSIKMFFKDLQSFYELQGFLFVNLAFLKDKVTS